MQSWSFTDSGNIMFIELAGVTWEFRFLANGDLYWMGEK